MNNNTPRKTNNIITQHRTYTSIEQIRNTQGWDYIYIESQSELNTETDSQRYGVIIELDSHQTSEKLARC